MENLKRLTPALFAGALIAFFLSFVSISCQGQKIVTLTGLQLITGAEVEPQLPGFEDMMKQAGVMQEGEAAPAEAEAMEPQAEPVTAEGGDVPEEPTATQPEMMQEPTPAEAEAMPEEEMTAPAEGDVSAGMATPGQEEMPGEVEPEPYAIAAFAAAGVGLVSSLPFVRFTFVPGVAGLAGGVLLLLLKQELDSEMLEGGAAMMQLEYGIGFWLALLLSFAGGVLGLYPFFMKRKAAAEPPKVAATSEKP